MRRRGYLLGPLLIMCKLLQPVGYCIVVCMGKAGGACGRREQGNEGRSEQEARGAVDASVVQLPP